MNEENQSNHYGHIVDLYKQILALQGLSVGQKRRLLNDVRSLIPAAQNRWNFRWVIWPLGILAMSIPVLYIVQLYATDKAPTDIPDGLLSLASAAVGALAAFLAPYGQRSEQQASTTPPQTLGAGSDISPTGAGGKPTAQAPGGGPPVSSST